MLCGGCFETRIISWSGTFGIPGWVSFMWLSQWVRLAKTAGQTLHLKHPCLWPRRCLLMSAFNANSLPQTWQGTGAAPEWITWLKREHVIYPIADETRHWDRAWVDSLKNRKLLVLSYTEAAPISRALQYVSSLPSKLNTFRYPDRNFIRSTLLSKSIVFATLYEA